MEKRGVRKMTIFLIFSESISHDLLLLVSLDYQLQIFFVDDAMSNIL